MTAGLVLLDWDGTVVDTRAVLLACWASATTAVLGRAYPADDAERARVLQTRGAEMFAELARDAEQAQELSTAFDASYGSHRAAPFDGVPAALVALRDAGCQLAVVTSKTRVRFEQDAAASGLDALLDVTVTGDDVRQAKPDPEGVLAAVAASGLPLETAVLIGDTAPDLLAGRAAGVPVLLAAWGYGDTTALESFTDHVVRRPQDLPADVASCRRAAAAPRGGPPG